MRGSRGHRQRDSASIRGSARAASSSRKPLPMNQGTKGVKGPPLPDPHLQRRRGGPTAGAGSAAQVTGPVCSVLLQGRAGRPPPAAQCPPSLTHFPKWPKHGKAAFCRFTVSLDYISRSGGGWRRSQESPQEARFFADDSVEWLLGLPEGSRAKRCPGSGPLPVSRVSATHPNPTWRPKQSSLWPPAPPNPAPDRPAGRHHHSRFRA
jgi:hypothetical protein